MKKFHPYRDAGLIDNKINSLLEQYPIESDNLTYWLTFCRTVRSSIDIIEKCVIDKLEEIKINV